MNPLSCNESMDNVNSLTPEKFKTYIRGFTSSGNFYHKNQSNIIYYPHKFNELRYSLDYTLNNLNEYVIKMNNVRFNNTEEIYKEYLLWAELMKNGTEEMTELITSYNHIVNSTHRGELSQYLLETEQQEIMLREHDKSFSGIYGKIGQLVSLKRIYYQRNFILAVSIPVLSIATFSLYKIYRLPIFQCSCTMILKSELEYLIIEEENMLHGNLNQQQLRNCVDLENYFICYSEITLSRGNSCEKSLLLSTQVSFTKCIYNDSPAQTNNWVFLSTTKG